MSASSNLKPNGCNFKTVIQALEESIRRNLSSGLLLSGGLDTALLAYIASKWSRPSCITVALRGAPAPDIEYASLVANRLELNHYVHYFNSDELDESIQAVIMILKTFDPMEIRNSAAVYIGLKVAKHQGLSTVMTGDGCDELFAGYSFLFGLTKEQLETALRKMSSIMRFSSVPLAQCLGIQVRLPFLEPEFRAFAEGLDAGLKVRSEGGQVWGKWVLRKAFEGVLPPELLWRVKAPIEVGTGTKVLPSLMDSRISDLEFAKEKTRYLAADRVVIRSKEHLFYYKIYRGAVGVPGAGDGSTRVCPDCGSSIEEEVSFCRICGAYPV